MITFREFLIICEKKSSIPPHAVPGTYQEVDGVKTYILAPYKGPSGPLKTEKKVNKVLNKQGGIGGGAIKKAKKKADKINRIGEDIEQRRQELHQRGLNTIQAHQNKVANYRDKLQAQRDKEEEHQEILKKVKKHLL